MAAPTLHKIPGRSEQSRWEVAAQCPTTANRRNSPRDFRLKNIQEQAGTTRTLEYCASAAFWAGTTLKTKFRASSSSDLCSESHTTSNTRLYSARNTFPNAATTRDLQERIAACVFWCCMGRPAIQRSNRIRLPLVPQAKYLGEMFREWHRPQLALMSRSDRLNGTALRCISFIQL
jgi:hypothetical protein